jgi:adenylate kinase
VSLETAQFLQLIAVCGLRGIGKSTVLRRLNELDSSIRVVFMSKELKAFSLKITGKDFFEHDVLARDDLREQFGSDLIGRLKDDGGTVVLDIHFTDIRESADKIIQPQTLIQNITAFIVLDASNDTIVERRTKDKELLLGRSFAILEIQRERESQLTAAQKLAAEHRRPLFFVSAEQTVDKICTEIRIALAALISSER